MSEFFQIYNNLIPDINENVLIIFNNRNDTHFEGELVEYNLKAIMSYNNATKKKKINNWSKIVPLNKILVAKIEENFYDNTVQVSTAYNDKNTDLLKPFNDNKVLLSFVRKICYNFELNLNDFWSNIIHPFDKLRRENKTDQTILNYIKDNLELLEEKINDHYNNDIYIKFNEFFNTNSHKLISKIGLVSHNNLTNIKNLINKTIEINNNFKYNFKYDTAPNYFLESLTNESNIEHHEKFINDLVTLSKECNVYSKVEFTGIIQ